MVRRPAITSLLKGQAVKTLSASISVTWSHASNRFNARAQAAPPKPPPTTVTRPADWAREIEGRANDAADAEMQRTAFRRVTGRAVMSSIPKMMRRPLAAASGSGEGDVLVAQRHRAD